jgi:hypothetical protein
MVDWANVQNGAGNKTKDIIREYKFLFWQTGNSNFQLKRNQ